MNIDLDKLSPAPWTPKRFEGITDTTTVAPEMSFTDWRFCCLARKAFDVMMRRGWTAHKDDEDGWVVCISDPSNPHWVGWRRTGPDPFTALVEADRWYREHVEKQ